MLKDLLTLAFTRQLFHSLLPERNSRPTESEMGRLDRFIEAMIKIREEIREIENGHVDKMNNLLKNAPHTANCIIKIGMLHIHLKKQLTRSHT